MYQDRKAVDDLKMQVIRLKKYDEFFSDCNRKLTSSDLVVKSIEKKLRDEINLLNGHKGILREKLLVVE